MITEFDLQEAIAECQGERNPDARTCMKLAAYYTILNEMHKEQPEPTIIDVPSYSEAPAEEPQRFDIKSGSEFAEVVNGKKIDDVMPLLDEMVQTVAAVEPALYNAFIRELKNVLP